MKRVIRYISEIILAVFLIFISYFAWDRIDVEAYEKFITQYTLEDIDLFLDDSFRSLSYVSDANAETSILTLNNYQNRDFELNVILELDGVTDDVVENLILVVDNNEYQLKELFTYNCDNKYYFLITNVSLNEYEKKSYNLKLLVNDNFEFDEHLSFSYNIIEEII